MISPQSRRFSFVFSAPSGTGKSTLLKALQKALPSVSMSVSATTRPCRKGEKNGEDYWFLTPEAFEIQDRLGNFLEQDTFCHYRYGTLKDPKTLKETDFSQGLEASSTRSLGDFVLYDLSISGALNLKKNAIDPQTVVTIFMLPPSLEILHQRLISRNREGSQEIQQRLDQAQKDIACWTLMDYVVINDQFDLCFQQVLSILTSYPLKTSFWNPS